MLNCIYTCTLGIHHVHLNKGTHTHSDSLIVLITIAMATPIVLYYVQQPAGVYVQSVYAHDSYTQLHTATGKLKSSRLSVCLMEQTGWIIMMIIYAR